MKRWLSAIFKILLFLLVVIAVLIIFTLSNTTANNPYPEETQSAQATLPPTAKPAPEPEPTETVDPTPEPAYIPEPDELQSFELAELVLEEGTIEYNIEYGSLLAKWSPLTDADYCVLYALDANDIVYHKDILWADIESWTISGIRRGSLLLLFYKDMGEKGSDDDILLKSLHQPLAADESMFTSEDNLQNKYYIIIDKEDFTIGIFTYEENGEYTKLVAAYPCAIGRSSRMTALGTFEISSKGAWKSWNATQYSPYYTKYTAGVYIHGPIYRSKNFNSLLYKSYNAIGTAATSGCIRTTVEGAMWIYYECPAGTVIEVVENSDKVDHVEKIPLDKNYPRWDPTDINKPVADTEG